MTKSLYCQIRVKGHLSSQWADWFGGLEIDNKQNGEAVLSVNLADQAALHGVLNRVRDLGLALISVKCVESRSDGSSKVLPGCDIERQGAWK